jgi:leader peptidase (prepilin peptidase)/N-methyltransferase
MDWRLGIIVFILGLLIGSFLNVCVWRVPRKESIVFPASHCPACGHPLAPSDLVPVVSWLVLRGRCRYCRERISWRYPAVELLTALIFTAVYWKFGVAWVTLPLLALVAVLIAVAFIDIDHAIIPNGLVLVGLVPGALVAAFRLNGLPWWDGLAGMAAGAAPLLAVDFLSRLILKKEGMGGGDMKLMAMVGLYLGWRLTLLSLLLAVYLGGLAGVILLATRVLKRGGQFPFGPFLAAGSLLSLFFGHPILSWWLGI